MYTNNKILEKTANGLTWLFGDSAEMVASIAEDVVIDVGFVTSKRIQNSTRYFVPLVATKIIDKTLTSLFSDTARWLRTSKRKSIAAHIPLTAWGFLPTLSAFMLDDCRLPAIVILLHGKPGTGKSYLAQYIASTWGWTSKRVTLQDSPSISINLGDGHPRPSKNGDEGEPTVTLIDEIDRFVEDPLWQTKLQNFIDDAQTGTTRSVIVLTTNNFEKIKDLPLCRLGRVDIIQEVGACCHKDVEAMAEFYGISNKVLYANVASDMRVSNIQQQAKLLTMKALIEKGSR